jgi:hypothetical protein
MTYDEIMRRVYELEEENRLLRNKIGEFSDELAEQGRIPNTPHAKLGWALGAIEATPLPKAKVE